MMKAVEMVLIQKLIQAVHIFMTGELLLCFLVGKVSEIDQLGILVTKARVAGHIVLP